MERKERVIEETIKMEWLQFQEVSNEGGRAACQDDQETFVIMRKSQFLAWDEEVIVSYLDDLNEAREKGWNLITEKYARMMESTAPEQYARFADVLPKREEARIRIQEDIISKEMEWAEEFAVKYPKLGATGRKIRTSEDTEWETSQETYLRGEISTYSDKTLALYYAMICRFEREGKNFTEMILNNMIAQYGYKTLEQTEERLDEDRRK